MRETGRKKPIIAGVTNDVCTVYPTLTALRLGYDVQVVAETGGSSTKTADDIAISRMEKAGATTTSTVQLLAELAENGTGERGGKIIPFVMGLMPQQ